MTAPTAPSADNLLIGKGQLLARKRLTASTFGPWFHMGNVTSGESSNEDTRLEKYSSMTAESPLYASRLQRRKSTLTIQFDEFFKDSIGMLTMAEITTTSAQAATPITGEVLSAAVPATALGTVLGGQIFFTALYGPMSAIVLDVGSTELVLGTDYEIVHNRKGQMAIRILPGSTVTTDGVDDLTIDYTPTAYAAGLTVLHGSKETTIEVQLKFLGDPTSGPAMQVDIWKANVNPTGALQLISEEYASGELQFEMLDDSINHPASALWDITLTDG